MKYKPEDYINSGFYSDMDEEIEVASGFRYCRIGMVFTVT